MVEKHKQHAAVEAALEENDYTAFTAAIKGTPMEGKVTQEQFTTMQTMHKKHEAVQDALKNNNYDAFVKATTPTKEEFAQMVKTFQENQNK
jgi:DNA-binding GntR family transcriptional regulator